MWFRVISFNRSGSEDSLALALFQTLISNRRQLIESPDDQDFSQFVPGAYSPHPTKEQYPVRTPQTPSSQHNHISPPTPAQRRRRWETPTPYPTLSRRLRLLLLLVLFHHSNILHWLRRHLWAICRKSNSNLLPGLSVKSKRNRRTTLIRDGISIWSYLAAERNFYYMFVGYKWKWPRKLSSWT